jgi:site-specific DNA recombinase
VTAALIYTRVSKDRKLSRSTAEQEAECRALCDREGWTVVDVLCDNGRSASRYATKSRPAWQEVKERVAAGDVDILVTWEASRNHRDLGEFVALRDLCRAHGVKLNYSGNTLDFDDSSDSFRAGLDALISEDESERTRARILRTVRQQAKKGAPHGKRLYGYKRKYDPKSGALIGQEPDPHEAAIVHEVVRRVLHGESAYRIARDLNRRGVQTQTGKPWSETRIKRLCVNPSYAAKRTHRGQVVGAADWLALIDEDTHAQLVAKFADPERQKFRTAGNLKHLLSGILRCGLCGARMWQAHDRGRGVYVCRNGGSHLARSQDHLDAYVTTLVLERLANEDLVAHEVRDPEAEAARLEAQQLRERLDGAVQQFTNGDLTAATLAKIEHELEPPIADADRRARPRPRSPLIDDLAGADVDTRWDRLNIEQQREVVRTLLDITVLPSTRKSGSRGFDPAGVRTEWRHWK